MVGEVAVVDVVAVVVVPHLAGFIMGTEKRGGVYSPGVATWNAVVVVDDDGGGGNEVGWWWWWEESDKWAVIEPRFPIWPLADRAVRQSHLTFYYQTDYLVRAPQ